MRKKQILARAIGISKKIVGKYAFLRDNYVSNHNSKKSVKYRIKYSIFFPNLSSIISEKCLVIPIFFFDFNSPT